VRNEFAGMIAEAKYNAKLIPGAGNSIDMG